MKFKIDRKSSVPLHIQAEHILRNLIQEEEYINGKLCNYSGSLFLTNDEECRRVVNILL